VTVPLILLAIPSVFIGAIAIEPMLFGDFFGSAIVIAPEHGALASLREHYHGWGAMALHALQTAPFWLAVAGVFSAWFIYMKKPEIADMAATKLKVIHNLLLNKYGLDDFNQIFFAGGSRGIGRALWRVGDVTLIDGLIVNGSAKVVGWCAGIVRNVQTGYLYHYAFAMIIGLLVLLSWFVIG
jgi:NADH-quinone oxidoreductase subunit L